MPGFSIALVVLLALLSCGCDKTATEPGVAEPKLGAWELISIDGAIRIRHAGGIVICRQGEIEMLPAPLHDPEHASESWLRLDPGRFLFSIDFEEGAYSHRFTNEGYGGNSFRGRWFESLSELRTEASWSWDPSPAGTVESSGQGVGAGQVAGSVTTGSAPEDWRPTFDLDPVPFREILDDPWITFEIEGRFIDASELEGQWTYHERTRLGGCWSYGEGSGTWRGRVVERSPGGD